MVLIELLDNPAVLSNCSDEYLKSDFKDFSFLKSDLLIVVLVFSLSSQAIKPKKIMLMNKVMNFNLRLFS